MDSKLLEAAISGDKNGLDELLQQNFSPGASREEITITIPVDAETQKVTSYLLGVTPEGNTALHIVASRGHLELAREICHRERSILEVSNMRLDTPLHHAAMAGHDEIVSLIIQFAREGWIEAKRVVRATNIHNANALHEAAKHNNASVATTLIEEDADLASMLDDSGMSPLYLAIVAGSHSSVAKALLQSSSWERASPASYAGPNKKTVLHAAVLLSPEIIKDMLRWEPMLTKCVDSSGRTPLHYAASDGDPDTVKLLLEHDPSLTAYLSDANGLFPLHLAVHMGNIPTVEQILQQCPETCEYLLDRKGKNFLHVAFKTRKLNVVRKIISKRPDLRKLLNDRDNKGNTPLHTAVKNGDEESMHFLLRDKTVDIDIKNHDGFTPLDLASAKLEKGKLFWKNADDYIALCLRLTNAQHGPRQLDGSKRITLSDDKFKRKSSSTVTKEKEKEEESSISYKTTKEMEKYRQLSQSLVVVSVLIVTVTFAAGFTVPGGYIADDHPDGGTAVLAKEYAFQVFLVSDAIAFVSSTFATLWFAIAGAQMVDGDACRRCLSLAIYSLWVAIAGMFNAFGMGTSVCLPSRANLIGILLCISWLAACLAQVVVFSSLPRVMRTSIERVGPELLFSGLALRVVVFSPFLPMWCGVSFHALYRIVVFIQK